MNNSPVKQTAKTGDSSKMHTFAVPTKHSLNHTLFIVVAIAITCASPWVPSAIAASETDSYQTLIRPYLTKYCFQCHGAEQQKADLRLDQLDPDMIHGSDTDMWQEVLDLTNVSEMPPQEVKQPSNEERQAMVDALTAALRKAMESKRSTGGRNVLRRMTAYEYNNTLRDLLQLDLRYAIDLPPEGVAKEGFKNNSGVLGTSALHIEYFERIARSALERIILVPDQQPKPYFVRVEPEAAFKQVPARDAKNKRNKSKAVGFTFKKGPDFSPGTSVKPGLFRLEHGSASSDGIILAGNRPSDRVGNVFADEKKIGGSQGAGRSGWQPEFRIEMYEVPHDAPLQVRIRCAAIVGANKSFPRLSFELGSFRGANVSDQKEAANIEVRSEEMETYEFVVQGANFPFQSNKPGRPSYFRIFNDYRRGTSRLPYEDLPKLNIDWVEITCNHFETWPSPQRQAILFESKHQPNEMVYAGEVIGKFMEQAYRRPVSSAEIERKVALFQRLRDGEPSFEHAIVSTLTAVLCSPHFLLLSEPESTEVAEDTELKKRRIDDYELASRLSYFLWSSMPDDTLFELAKQNKLHQKQVLIAQTRRMLADPKSKAFSQNFAAQWLDLAGIRRLAVNPEFFKFDERTKDLFEEETTRFLNHVLTENLPIQNFIDSDFAVLNPTLARHYRIPDISGGFQVIPISKNQHRGGLLTQASMLFGNSTGAETHPIKRGVWVLERMLDDPPPPPPPNVPDLPEKPASDDALLSLKERLVAHADEASCRDCHRKIDPWGVAFENYNALGQWREGTKDPLVLAPHQAVNIDPATRLSNGTKIEDLNDLKRYLLTEKESEFRRAVVNKVMSYGLGRYLEFADRPAIDSVCEKLQKRGDRFQTLIEQIVLSEPFSNK
ncbi:MAG: DUF1592 domain-containing protein [Planctomycetaceae bacterium]|nr:DUF1592 domain-containing protein [Planctomycetaceae bacterium]